MPVVQSLIIVLILGNSIGFTKTYMYPRLSTNQALNNCMGPEYQLKTSQINVSISIYILI